jgi:hypothetical protein
MGHADAPRRPRAVAARFSARPGVGVDEAEESVDEVGSPLLPVVAKLAALADQAQEGASIFGA